jgi:tRNA nucleotidyltransferase (CCA-adding enzyme)
MQDKYRKQLNAGKDVVIEKASIDKLINPHVQKMFDMFKFFGFELRIIGGTVRDILLGKVSRDLDFATNANPYEIIYIFNELTEEREAVASYGIEHGTIVLKFKESEQYEVTSINFQIHVKDNKIEISQNLDWEHDAARRDFTVNAMSMDLSGKVYDYEDGLEDLKNQKIVFLGDYKAKIKHDPVMILRFFKLLGKFEDPDYEEEALEFIADNKELLHKLRQETVEWFDGDMKKQPHYDNIKSAMKEAGISLGDYISESTLNQYLYKLYV